MKVLKVAVHVLVFLLFIQAYRGNPDFMNYVVFGDDSLSICFFKKDSQSKETESLQTQETESG
jgi:hypothetical protein